MTTLFPVFSRSPVITAHLIPPLQRSTYGKTNHARHNIPPSLRSAVGDLRTSEDEAKSFERVRVRVCVCARLDDNLSSWKNNQIGREIRSRAVRCRAIVRGFRDLARRSIVAVGKKILFIDAWSVVDGQARTRETLIRRESNVTIDTRHLLPARCSPVFSR